MRKKIGAIFCEESDIAQLYLWKTFNLHDIIHFKQELESEVFIYGNKNWRFVLGMPFSNGVRNGGVYTLRLCIVDASSDKENIAAFKSVKGTLVFEAVLKVWNNFFYSEEIDNSIVFYVDNVNCFDAELHVRFLKNERDLKSENYNLIALNSGVGGTKNEPGTCSDTEFVCKSSKCIPNPWQCDWENDCMDLSDDDLALRKEAERLKRMYIEKIFCDLTVTVKERTFHVHKIILFACSPVFADMILKMDQSSNNNINIPDCDPEIFHVFLLFLYGQDTSEITDENVINVYIFVNKYSVESLKKWCCQYMKKNLSVDSFCDIIQLAAEYKELELMKLSKQFFVKNSKKIFSAAKFHFMMNENKELYKELNLLITPDK